MCISGCLTKEPLKHINKMKYNGNNPYKTVTMCSHTSLDSFR